ncbi:MULTISPECIES: hypothetical protein [unclassified Sphingomonas]|uniref:hypothetical protein n=1 Tax=unclassified Sphingomonas TaxID=196159 RepID=UPI0006F66E67|nr:MULTISPECIES: hypothetical protein [unclassified Sphingomonas]KQM28530.1 hypothetical protein ASE58_01195 [Sphingomonas sp. Leaf9]KQM45236.1 hypothetical protein ASE57_01195 [Sphingomonas sp. Leaf11]
MTGGQKAAAIIALAVVALAWFNWRMWRQFSAAKAYRAGWSTADFDAMVAENGVTPAIAALTRDLVAPCYGEGVVPHPDDDFARFLMIDDEDVADLVEAAWARLGLAIPKRADPVELPPMKDVRDLAVYLQSVA